MTSKEEVEAALSQVLVPEVRRSLAQLNMIRAIEVASDEVKVTLASTALDPAIQDWVEAKARAVLEEFKGIKEVAVEFVKAKPQELNQIGHVLAIMSGKGGVGKSLVTALLAMALNRQGCEVGILDADITGPSIPRMFGISARPGGSDTGILTVLSRSGIEIMSVNLLLPHEDDAVIWRGPLIGNAIRQFWEEVLWGRLDYLLVDLPPGTADAPLTVMQSLPLSGVIIVFTPQDLAAMVVRKAVHMAQKMNVPILGVVENMSYFLIPRSGEKVDIFGSSKGEEMAMAAGAPLLGQIPIDPELARLCDEGNIERYDSAVIDGLAQAFLGNTSAEAG